MSSNDKDTNEASLNEKMKWYTQQLLGRLVERSRSQRLAEDGHWEWRLNYCNFCQITARNANKFMLLRYNNIDRHKGSLAKFRYIFTSTFRDLQMPRCGREKWRIFVQICFVVSLHLFFFKKSHWQSWISHIFTRHWLMYLEYFTNVGIDLRIY